MSTRKSDWQDAREPGKGRDDRGPHDDRGGHADQEKNQESDRRGRFQDRVEKLERPGEWPPPPPDREQ
jgi:hypothetical protein